MMYGQSLEIYPHLDYDLSVNITDFHPNKIISHLFKQLFDTSNIKTKTFQVNTIVFKTTFHLSTCILFSPTFFSSQSIRIPFNPKNSSINKMKSSLVCVRRGLQAWKPAQANEKARQSPEAQGPPLQQKKLQTHQ